MGLELKVEQKQRVYQKQIEQARILQMNAQEIAVYMKAHMEENLKIEQIAREYGMNRSGLTRAVPQYHGMPASAVSAPGED